MNLANPSTSCLFAGILTFLDVFFVGRGACCGKVSGGGGCLLTRRCSVVKSHMSSAAAGQRQQKITHKSDVPSEFIEVLRFNRKLGPTREALK